MRIAPIIEQLTGVPNNWTGAVTTTNKPSVVAQMDWDGTLIINPALFGTDADPLHVLTHELLHASGGATEDSFQTRVWLEEGVTEALTRELMPEVRKALGMPETEGLTGVYDEYVAALEGLRSVLDIPYRTFYMKLLNTPLEDRLGVALDWAIERAGLPGVKQFVMARMVGQFYVDGATYGMLVGGATRTMRLIESVRLLLGDTDPVTWWEGVASTEWMAEYVRARVDAEMAKPWVDKTTVTFSDADEDYTLTIRAAVEGLLNAGADPVFINEVLQHRVDIKQAMTFPSRAATNIALGAMVGQLPNAVAWEFMRYVAEHNQVPAKRIDKRFYYYGRRSRGDNWEEPIDPLAYSDVTTQKGAGDVRNQPADNPRSGARPRPAGQYRRPVRRGRAAARGVARRQP